MKGSPLPPSAETQIPQRFFEADLIKAAGIAAVVLIHSMRSFLDPGFTPTEEWLGQLTSFAVPGFLFVSGWLYASSPRGAGPAATQRRLRRILVPYLVASVLAQLYHGARGAGPETGSALWDLLFAASFGPYYYVFQIVLLVLLAPLLQGLSARTVGVLAAVAVLVQGPWIAYGFVFDVFWELRNPVRFWGYFLVGWWLRLHYPALRQGLVSRRPRVLSALVTTVAILAVGLALETPPPLHRLLGWLLIYALLGLVVAAGVGRGSPPSWLRRLSDASYAVYLFHLFFIYWLRPFFPFEAGELALLPILVPWAAGLLGPLLVVALARPVLGPRSRDWLGA